MRIYITLLLLSLSGMLHAQSLENKLKDWAANYVRTDANIKPSTLVSCQIDEEEKTISIVMGGGFPEQHFTPAIVEAAYQDAVENLLPEDQKNYDISIETDGRPIEELVPNFFRQGKRDHHRQLSDVYKGEPWITNVSRPYTAQHGLEGRHIALWQSHGRYYKSEKSDWYWQRPRLFCTTEDLLSQTFVVPYIIPMLQNAGATVFTPRERDYQSTK